MRRSFKKPELKQGVAKKEINIDSVSNFIKVADTVDLTEPQEEILNNYKRGYRLKTINSHYASGGSYVWEDQYGNEHYAGKVYKAFWNLIWKVESIYGHFDKNMRFGETR